MKSTVEILREARERVSDPKFWTACALNAISQAADGNYQFAKGAYAALARSAGIDVSMAVFSIPQWNDSESLSHAEMLAAFDRAIAVEEAREQEHTASHIRTCAPVLEAEYILEMQP